MSAFDLQLATQTLADAKRDFPEGSQELLDAINGYKNAGGVDPNAVKASTGTHTGELQADVAELQSDTTQNTADVADLQLDITPLLTDVPQLQLDVTSLQFATKQYSVTVPFTLPAPTGAAATKDFIAFKAPADGELIGVEIIPNSTWVAGDNVGDKYLTSVYRFNNTPGDVNFVHDLLTGVAAGASALLPSGDSSALLTAGQNLTLDATGSSMLFTNAVAWVTTPSIGDYVSITSGATSYVGATPSNPGVYVITASSSTTITATKLYGSNPEDVTVAAAGAGDVAALRLISQQEASFVEGDIVGLRVIVPIDTTTPVDVSALSFSAIFHYQVD